MATAERLATGACGGSAVSRHQRHRLGPVEPGREADAQVPGGGHRSAVEHRPVSWVKRPSVVWSGRGRLEDDQFGLGVLLNAVCIGNTWIIYSIYGVYIYIYSSIYGVYSSMDI